MLTNGKIKSILDDPAWLNTIAYWRLYGVKRDGSVWMLEDFFGTFQEANSRAWDRVKFDGGNRFASWFLEDRTDA